jgi:hypothetical protein
MSPTERIAVLVERFHAYRHPEPRTKPAVHFTWGRCEVCGELELRGPRAKRCGSKICAMIAKKAGRNDP